MRCGASELLRVTLRTSSGLARRCLTSNVTKHLGRIPRTRRWYTQRKTMNIVNRIISPFLALVVAAIGQPQTSQIIPEGTRVKVRLCKEGKSWQKTLRVTSGSTPTVNAILEDSATAHSNGEIKLDSASFAAKQNAPATPTAPMPDRKSVV